MASGKQTSFQYGEVSPSLKFKSDEVSYSQGLGKVRNMYVRRTGGASNRAGLKYLGPAISQYDIPTEGGDAGIKGYSFWSPVAGRWVTLEYCRDTSGTYNVFVDGIPRYLISETITGPTPDQLRFTLIDDAVFMTPNATLQHMTSGNSRKVNLALNDKSTVNLPALDTTFGNNVFPNATTITGASGGSPPNMPVTYLVTAIQTNGEELIVSAICTVGSTLSPFATGSGLFFPHAEMTAFLTIGIALPTAETPFVTGQINGLAALPVVDGVYVVTTAGGGKNLHEIWDRSGGTWTKLVPSYVGNSYSFAALTGGTITFPTAGYYQQSSLGAVSWSYQGALAAAVPIETKSLNIYRAGGALNNATGNYNATTGAQRIGREFAGRYYKLAGSIPYDGTVADTVFTDFGADDPAITPPLDKTMLTATGGTTGIVGGTSAAYYQQRSIISLKAGINESIKNGCVIVSKLGAPRQLKAPLIYSDTGAFRFNIPVTDGTPVVALLAMERLMAFTERGVYAIRGGDQGILTPTTVNPLIISDEGCSSIVEPKMSGKRGYFINNDHTKLMGIVFGVDGNMQVFEASVFSDHMLSQDIVQMEVLGGKEDTVFLVRRDGKLVQITCTQEGTHGFSVMETNGHIEGIYRGKDTKPFRHNHVSEVLNSKLYDVLFVYVIRNGVRNVEKLELRDDVNREGEFFADCFIPFGVRLAGIANQGYQGIQAGAGTFSAILGQTINIETPLSGIWSAGETIKIKTNYQLSGDVADIVLHFFYEDQNGKQFLRYMIDRSSETVSGIYFVYTGYFTADVPLLLRDVDAQAISAVEKMKRKTRWSKAVNRLTGNSHLFGPWLAASKTPTVDGSALVSVVADGAILSSPLNPNTGTPLSIVRTAGVLSLELGDYYSWGYVGVPYTCELETMDLETSDNRTLSDAKKIINAVGVGFYETRGGFFGMPNKDLSEMEELVSREDENFNNQTANVNDYITINMPAEFNRSGRVNIKHVDPAPMTVLAVYPKGISGD